MLNFIVGKLTLGKSSRANLIKLTELFTELYKSNDSIVKKYIWGH